MVYGILSRIMTMQAAFSTISQLNLNSNLFSSDTTPRNGASYDYLIVGGGIEGSVVAARLVEAGYFVLVIEAGGIYGVESHYSGLAPFTKNTRADWNYTAEPDGFTGGCHKSSGMLIPRVLGGNGAVDFMIYSRGNPSDYAKWVKATNDNSWSWKHMMKYFKKSENLKDPAILNSAFCKYHGICGKVNITRDSNDLCDVYIKGFEAAGEPVPLDNVGNASLGYSRALYNIENGVRKDAALSYLMPLKDNPKLHISFHSLVTKIVFDEHKNAKGVEFIKDGKKMTVKANKEVIICAGSIKSPQLLMLSGIGPKKQLDKFNLPCISDIPVGQNLQNLVGVFLPFKTNKKNNPEPLIATEIPVGLVIGHTAINKSHIYPNYETLNFIISDPSIFLILCAFTLAYQNNICDQLSVQAKDSEILTTILFNLNVESRGQIELRSADPKDSPKIRPGYYANKNDLEAVVEEIEDYMKVVSTPHFKEMGLKFMEPNNKCSHLKFGSKLYWRCYALCMTAETQRFVASNAMGSVVDTRLCVIGVNKLRVVDASVMPSTISGPISGSTVALAEKGAKIIISEAN